MAGDVDDCSTSKPPTTFHCGQTQDHREATKAFVEKRERCSWAVGLERFSCEGPGTALPSCRGTVMVWRDVAEARRDQGSSRLRFRAGGGERSRLASPSAPTFSSSRLSGRDQREPASVLPLDVSWSDFAAVSAARAPTRPSVRSLSPGSPRLPRPRPNAARCAPDRNRTCRSAGGRPTADYRKRPQSEPRLRSFRGRRAHGESGGVARSGSRRARAIHPARVCGGRPAQRAYFDASAKRALWWQEPFLATDPKNGCRRKSRIHQAGIPGGREDLRWGVTMGWPCPSKPDRCSPRQLQAR